MFCTNLFPVLLQLLQFRDTCKNIPGEELFSMFFDLVTELAKKDTVRCQPIVKNGVHLVNQFSYICQIFNCYQGSLMLLEYFESNEIKYDVMFNTEFNDLEINHN